MHKRLFRFNYFEKYFFFTAKFSVLLQKLLAVAKNEAWVFDLEHL
jgi:hypothetical protein